MPGLFVTFEGGEGGGKSTQFARLAQHIRASGRTVAETREPGGTPQGESLRALLVNGATDQWSPEAEALLNYAARDAHLRLLIRPALARGETVISDRFMDSTRAYQAIAGRCSKKLIDVLEQTIVGTTRPDLTIILDIDPELGLARARSRGIGKEDRYERKGLDFHRRIRDAFRAIANADPRRCRMIDASQSEEAVTRDIIAAYEDAIRG